METWQIIILVLGGVAASYFFLFYGLIYGAEYQRISGKRLKKLIELGRLSPDKKVYDLGAGYGRIAFKAALSGAQVTAVEIDPVKVVWLRAQAHRKLAFEMATNINVVQEDIRKTYLSDADIIYCYLSHPLMESLAARAGELKLGCQIISAEHRINNWKPTFEDKESKIYVYTVGESNV